MPFDESRLSSAASGPHYFWKVLIAFNVAFASGVGEWTIIRGWWHLSVWVAVLAIVTLVPGWASAAWRGAR